MKLHATFFAVTALAATLSPLGAPPADAPVSTAVRHVHIIAWQFEPTYPLLSSGDSIEWHNHDETLHTATSNASLWDSGLLGKDETYKVTFATMGTFPYYCIPHAGNMTGSLKVGPNKPPTVTIDEPRDGDLITGIARVAGTANEPDPGDQLREVQIRVDEGTWKKVTGTLTWTHALDTYDHANGPHRLDVRAWDSWEYSNVASIEVIVENPPWVDAVIATLTAEGIGAPKLRAEARNLGTAAAGPFEVGFYYEYEGTLRPIGTARVAGLGPGESAIAETTWIPLGKVGTFPIVAIADDGKVLAEAREANNAATTTVDVITPAEPVDALPHPL